MRQRERIPLFLDKLCPEMLHKLFIKWFNTNFEETEQRICKEKRKIKKFWIANHDLRFSQVLINMGYIDNIPGSWYYTEDDEALIFAGYEPREVLLWGQRYDKMMNPLPYTKWLSIESMSTDHIKAVMSFMKDRLPLRYHDAFIAELTHREGN
jgi:hypothetical protein